MADKKKVVYLFGAGATQGEINFIDDNIQQLATDVKDGMLEKLRKKPKLKLKEVINELTDDNIDVEHLITLYQSSGTTMHSVIARELKTLFREEIEERINRLPKDFQPTLFAALIDMHQIEDNDEKLSGLMTINYDDLAEKGIQRVHDKVNYSIKVKSSHSKLKIVANSTAQILKLHGSFNWKNEFPVRVTDNHKIKGEHNVLWIPPGVIKRRENYPFSLLWGKAREMLDCDILRIIGCSLSRNDWELIALLYTTQKFYSAKKQYTIELIDYVDIGIKKRKEYPYLRINTILDLPYFRDYLILEFFTSVKAEDKISDSLMSFVNSGPKKPNIFEMWLRAKGKVLKDQQITLDTEKNIFKDFNES